LDPDQAPDAVQAVAFEADQFKVAAPPLVIVLGAALKVTAGNADLIETVADCAAVPPGPVHERTYVAAAVRGPVVIVPESALLPDQAPDAVQAVA
jgi:hypothetical protein